MLKVFSQRGCAFMLHITSLTTHTDTFIISIIMTFHLVLIFATILVMVVIQFSKHVPKWQFHLLLVVRILSCRLFHCANIEIDVHKQIADVRSAVFIDFVF